MEVIGHQDIDMEGNVMSIEGDAQTIEASLPVAVVADNGLPGIAPTGHMVEGTRIGDQERTSHAEGVARRVI